MHRQRKEATLAFTRYFQRRHSLNLKRPRDVEFLQFETVVFSECLTYLARKAEHEEPMRPPDWYWLADKLLKGRKAFQFWKGPSATDTAQAINLLWKVCWLLVKNYK